MYIEHFKYYRNFYYMKPNFTKGKGKVFCKYAFYDILTQAVRRSPPTAGVPSSRLGHSMWVSWWTIRGLVRFFSRFLQFSPSTNFVPPFLHTHLIHFVSFHQPLWWCVRRGRPTALLLTDLQYGASSHLIPRPDLVLDTSWGYLYYDILNRSLMDISISVDNI